MGFRSDTNYIGGAMMADGAAALGANVTGSVGVGASCTTAGCQPAGIDSNGDFITPPTPTGGGVHLPNDDQTGVGEPGIGGMGNCNRCMPEDVVPSGQTIPLDYRNLFEGDEGITSQYGFRKIRGVSEFHGGMDFAPKPNTGFGTRLFAPSSGRIIRVTSGGIHFRPSGFSSNTSLLFYHVSLAPNLSGTPLPINVQSGSQIGSLANVGRVYGAHVHIQLESGGNLYNPRFVFP